MRSSHSPRFVSTFAGCLALALGLGAADSVVALPLSAEAEGWAKGPAAFLFTDADRDAWKAVSNDQEAADFVRLFWARRDATPETPENEFKVQFDQRVAAADQRFGDDKTRGALSDRGRVLILLGAPNRAAKEGGSEFAGGSDASGGGSGIAGTVGGGTVDYSEAFEEVWTYEKDRMPTGVKGNRLLARFRTERGYGTGVLDRQAGILNALAKAAEGAVTRPALTLAELGTASTPAAAAAAGEVDVPELAWQATVLTDAALLAALTGDPATLPKGVAADLDAAAFAQSDGKWAIAVQLMMREPAAQPLALVGLVRDAGGNTRLPFRREQAWQVSGGRSFQTQALVLPPGDYDLRVGLVGSDGAVLFGAAKAVTVPELTADQLWLSDLIVSEDVHALKEKQHPYDPWAWQGVAVVPKGGGQFAPGAALWLYLHACGLKADVEGKPSVDVVVELGGPKRLRGPMVVDPSPAGKGCHVLATGIDLVAERFPVGVYTTKMQVKDKISGQTVTAPGGFEIVAP